MEGMLRRELDGAGASLDAVEHGDDVRFTFSLPASAADALRARLDEAGHGRIGWPSDADDEDGVH